MNDSISCLFLSSFVISLAYVERPLNVVSGLSRSKKASFSVPPPRLQKRQTKSRMRRYRKGSWGWGCSKKGAMSVNRMWLGQGRWLRHKPNSRNPTSRCPSREPRGVFSLLASPNQTHNGEDDYPDSEGNKPDQHQVDGD